MNVSVTEAKNKLTQLLAAVEQGERVVIRRHGRVIAELVQPSVRRAPRFGTLKGFVAMTPEQVHEATRPMTEAEAEAFLQGRR
ncbi:MAG: type II toxin-antitoxin system prevent-host-death family antitoxin [Acidobacteria bacterium]|nr:type II toxin-antitoxin system prevent-host-death family antitoxin [Acidobacteriota bacterium]